MQRALVIGISGAGKSTFAARLARQTGLPLTHLDAVFWQPGWHQMPRPRWRETVAGLVAAERWILEGNYGSTLDLRLPRADTVFWFDYPRRIAIPRILRRVAKTYGQVRADMAPGCPEQIDLSFLKWVWDFPARERPLIAKALEQHGRHLAPVIFRRDRDVGHFLASLGRRG